MLRKSYVKLISMVLTMALLCGALTETFAYSERILPDAGYAAVKNVDLNGTFADSPSILERYRSMLNIAKAERTAVGQESAAMAEGIEEEPLPEKDEQKAVEYAVSQVSPAIQTAQTVGALPLVGEMDSAWQPAVDENVSEAPNNPDLEMGDAFGMNEEAEDELSAQDDFQVLDILEADGMDNGKSASWDNFAAYGVAPPDQDFYEASFTPVGMNSEANEGTNAETDENINAEGEGENKESGSDEKETDGQEESGGESDEEVLPQETEEETFLLEEPEMLLADVVLFSGEGTAESPFLIENEEQLLHIVSVSGGGIQGVTAMDAHYRLTADLDLNGAENFYGIGSSQLPFSGVFDGGGHLIKISIHSNDNYIGLFRSVKNAELKNIIVSGAAAGSWYVGGVTGYASSSRIINCISYADITGAREVGGIAGTTATSSAIENCMAAGRIISVDTTSFGAAGGITGSNRTSSSIRDSHYTGAQISASQPGMIAGNPDITSTIEESWYHITFSGAPQDMEILLDGEACSEDWIDRENGKISLGIPVKKAASSSLITNNQPESIVLKSTGYFPLKIYLSENNEKKNYKFYFGDISLTPSDDIEDQFSGEGTDESPFLIYNEKQLEYLAVIGNGELKGIPAFSASYRLMEDIDLSSIKDFFGIGSYAVPFTGSFDGNGHEIKVDIVNAGPYTGVFGYLDNAVVKKLVTAGSIAGASYTGGIAGYAKDSLIENCVNQSTMSGGLYLGGIAGCTLNTFVKGSVNESAVYGSQPQVGGITGYMVNSSLEDCVNNGPVSGSSNVGGMAGYAENSEITRCYTYGNIGEKTLNSSITTVGGISGLVNNSRIDNCFAASNIFGNNYVGGLVGQTASDTQISSSHYAGAAIEAGRSENTGILVGRPNTALKIKDSGFYIQGKVYPEGVQISLDGTLWDEEFIQLDGAVFSLFVPVQFNSSGNLSNNLPGQLLFTKDGWLSRIVYLSKDNQKKEFTLHLDDTWLDSEEAADGIEGEGTKEDPFLLSTAEQFMLIYRLGDRELKGIPAMDASYRLMQDIDLRGQNDFLGFGSTNYPFRGKFDGNGYEIKLDIQAGEADYLGLFRYTENAKIENVKRSGTVSGNQYVGSIAGQAVNTEISGIVHTGQVTGDQYVGGFTGYLDSGSIQDSQNHGYISGKRYIGGAAGYIESGSIQDSQSHGNTSGENYIGGIAGSGREAVIQNSSNSGTVMGTSYIGGIVGALTYTSTLNNSSSTAEVTGGSRVGGLAGYLSAYKSTGSRGILQVEDCYADGTVTGSDYVGGLAGQTAAGYNTTNNVQIEGSFYQGKQVAGSSNIGVLIGSTAADTVIQESGFQISGTVSPDDAGIMIDGYRLKENQIWRDGPTYLAIMYVEKAKNGIASGNTPEFVQFRREGYESISLPLFSEEEGFIYSLNLGLVQLQENGEEDFIRGEGTPELPFLIETPEQFDYILSIQNMSLKGYPAMEASYRLMTDLDLRDKSDFYGIATSAAPFKGTFDGNGHKVSLSIDAGNAQYVGFFRSITDALVENLEVDGYIKGGSYVGSVSGYATRSVIKNTKSHAELVSGNSNIGGITGGVNDSCLLENVHSNVEVVSGNSYIGGIAGYSNSGSTIIRDSVFSGNNIVSTTGNSNIGILTRDASGFTYENSGYYIYGEIVPSGAAFYLDGMLIDESCVETDGNKFSLFVAADKDTNKPGEIQVVKNGYWTQRVPLSENYEKRSYTLDMGALVLEPNDAEDSIQGQGTDASPFLIETEEQWLYVSGILDLELKGQPANSAHYQLAADLDLTDAEEYWGFGRAEVPFTGRLDGNGHEVKLNINSVEDHAGLFRYTQNAVIENITVSGSVSGKNNVGGLVGYAENTAIKGSVNKAEISGNLYVGGIAGRALEGGELSECRNEGSAATLLNSGNSYVGGIVGAGEGLFINHCINLGIVDGKYYSGGIAGNIRQSKLLECINEALIQGTNYTGGILGDAEDTKITDAENSGTVNGSHYIGGIAGRGLQIEVGKARSEAVINGDTNIGGIVGRITSSTALYECEATSEITGTGTVGGIAGYVSESTISACSAAGNVTVSGNNAGGIAGNLINSVIEDSLVKLDILGEQYVGGIAGAASANTSGSVEIRGTIVAGNEIKGSRYVGTVVGDAEYRLVVEDSGFYITGVIQPSDAQISLDGRNCDDSWVSREDDRFIILVPVTKRSLSYTIENNTVGVLTFEREGYTVENIHLSKNNAKLEYELNIGAVVLVEDHVGGSIAGAGTDESPFLIENEAQFLYIASLLNSELKGIPALQGSYRLEADLQIDNESQFYGIGNENNRFTGSFDGNGHEIKLDITGHNYVGLFSYLNNAEVKNLKVSGKVTGSEYVGGIAGYSVTSSFDNCINEAAVNGNSRAGGITGYDRYSSIDNCTNYAEIYADDYAGGIGGELYFSTVKKVVNEGSVKGGSYTGGIAGRLNYGAIDDSLNRGQITSYVSYTGGIAGRSEGRISDCDNEGVISGVKYTGGIVGYLWFSNSAIERCVQEGSVTGDSYTGGIAGSAYANAVIKDCEVINSTIAGRTSTGGIAGTAESNSQVENANVKHTDISGTSQTGGIAGELLSSSIMSDCNVTGGTVRNTDNHTGGIAGRVYGSSTIQQCEVKEIQINGQGYTGGIAGYLNGTISNSTVTVDVQGTHTVGGIAGHSTGVIEGCTVLGDVTGSSNIGGITGDAVDVTILDSVTESIVKASAQYAGGIAGRTKGTTLIAESTYKGSQISGRAGSIGMIAGVIEDKLTVENSSYFITGSVIPSDAGIQVDGIGVDDEQVAWQGSVFTAAVSLNKGIWDDFPLNQPEKITVTKTGFSSNDVYLSVNNAKANYITNIGAVELEPRLDAPRAVTGLTAVSGSYEVALYWDMAYEANVEGYYLYRSELMGSGYRKLADITGREVLTYTDRDVTVGQWYFYKISAYNLNSESELSDYVHGVPGADTQPPVILGISPIDDATVGKYTDITVRLEDNIALKEVWLEYQIDEDEEWVFIDKKTISGTSAAAVFNLGEIPHHGPIRVRALAEDHNGNISDGNPVRLYYLDTTGPEKVTGFSGTPTESAVTLRWNDVPDRDFAYFAVEQKNEGEAEYTQIAKVAATLGHHVTGLTPDTNYWFRVRAFDIYDNPGEYSDEIQVYTQGDAEKPRVISIRPMPGYYTSVIPVTVNASDNIAVASVEVELSTDGTSWNPAASKTVENPAKSVTLSFDIDISLIPEGPVFVRAFAEDAAGNRSNPSSVVEHRIDRTPPAAPTGLTVESTAEYILLQWEKGNETDLRYYSVYRSDDGSYYRKISGNLTSLGYYDQQAVHGNTYYYRITAVDAAGNESNPSSVVSASLAEDTTAPWIYSVSPKDGSILGPDPTIRVQARDNVDLAQIIVEYFDAGDWYTIGKSNVSGTSASASFKWDTDRVSAGEYTVRFYAVDRAGNTGDSYEVEYELKNYVIAQPVAVLTPGDMSITITWRPISHTDPVRYRVYRIDNGRDVLLTEIDVNGETSYTDHRLDPAQVYEYFVEVYDARGNASPSEVVSGQPINNDPYPPVANAGFDMNTLVGVQTAFNGDLSTDNIGIAKYLWNFGDGAFGEGEKTVHVYQETGTYTVTLTVEDDFGNRDSDSIQVKALLPSQAGTVLVKVVDNETGEILSDASVYIDLPEEPMLLRTDENGEVSIAAEPGTYGVSAYKIGYLPKEISVKVEQYGDTKTTLGISKGQLVIGEVITERLTLDQIGELGIDTSDPDNRHVFNFKVSLIFQEKEYDYDFNIDRWGNFYAGGGGYKRWKIDYDDQSAYVHAVPSKNPEVPPTLSILTVSNSVGFLKEFYSVSVVMQNMADPQFVLTDNVYRLNLPSGLSLADTAEKQDFSIQADDLPGGEVSIATWIVRGDKAGSYKLSVNYNGTLMPFEEPVEAVFSTDEDLLVDGSQGLKIYVWADEYGFPGEDYYVAFAVYNQSNFPRYDIKATFGDNLPTIRYEYTLVDENGNKSQHTSTEGTTYVVETPDQMHRIPVLTSHDSILMQTLVPGEAFFGYYQTTFPGSDPETFYHELVNGFSEILGGSTVDIPVILMNGSSLRPGGYWELGTWANGSGLNDLGYFELEEEVLKVTGVNEIPFNLRYYSGYTSPHEDDVFNEGPDDDAWDFPASGWSSSYEMKAVTQIDGTINLYLAPGIGLRFIHEDAKNRIIPGELKNGNVHLRAASLVGNYFSKDIGYQNYKLVKNDDDTIVLTDPDKTNYYFNKDGRLVRIENHQKQIIEISRVKTEEDVRVLIVSEQGSDQKIIASYDGSGNLTGVRDTLGREVRVEHERTSEGLSVGSLITASGDKVSYEYDGFNVTGKSVNGKTIFSQTFDDKGRVTSRTDGEGRTSHFEYDDEITFWQTATKTTDRNGNQQVTIANRQGQTISETDGLGHTSYYTYNAGGRMTSARDAGGNTRIFDYDENDNLISTEDPEGIKESITYDDRGNMLTFTTETGAVTTYEYSDKNWLLKKVDERGVVTQYTYNDYGQVLTETVLGLGTTYFTYENGRLASTTDVLGQTERLQYDAAGRPVSSTDRDGNTTHFAYDVMDQLIKVTDPRGYEIHYAYDDQGNVISQTDQRGNVTSYEYDGNGNLVKEINALGEAFTYEYDGEGNLVKTTSPEGSFVQYVYDAAGQQTAVIDPEEGTAAYEYDPAGQLVKTIYPNGGVHTVQYDRSGRKTSETNPLSGTTTYQYNNMGQLALVTDPAGNSRWYTYDTSGNPLSARDGEGGAVSAEYDIYGRLVSQTDANGNKMLFEYDQKGQRIKEIDPLGNAVSYTYNGRGQVVKQTDAKGGEISVVYDGTGNPTTVTNALGNTIAMEYDQAGNQTVMRDAYGTAIETIAYDALNRKVASTDALGNTKRIEYDSVGRKTAEITALNEVTTFTYNKRGQLLTQTEPEGGVTVYTYDAEGNMTSLRDPMEGLSSYSYDLAGNLIREQKANGGVKTYTYNTAGQRTQSVNARGQQFEYTYDRAGRVTEEEGIHYTYDSNGNVLTVRNSEGTVFRTYDALNRVKSYSGIYGDMMVYAYDVTGNLTEITYPDGKAVKYTYDPAGQMKTVTDYAGRVTSYEYNKNGNLVKTEYPNGVAEELAYGLNGWMESRTSRKGTTVVSSGTYTYDGNGNLIVEVDDAMRARNSYDKNGRLTGKTDTWYTGRKDTFAFTYDAGGNMLHESLTSRPGSAGRQTDMSYGPGNQAELWNGQALSFDLDGNMTRGPLDGVFSAFEYDQRNQLVRAGSTRYTYDGDGTRVGQSITGGRSTQYTVNSNAALSQLLVKKDSDGSSTYYVYGNSLISQERIDAEGGRQYRIFHYDFRGSTVAMTDQYGNVTDRITYDPYGAVTSRTGNTDTIFLYNGKYGVQTDDNGLIYMRARYYSSDLKRFISEDPKKDRVNWYTYGYSNPLNHIDPEGTIAPAVLAVASYVWRAVNTGLRVYSIYSTIDSLVNKDWLGAGISAIGVLPGKAFSSIGSQAAKRFAVVFSKIAKSKVGSKIAAAAGGVLRNGGRTSTVVATTAKNAVRTGSQGKTAGSAVSGGLKTGGGGVGGSLIGPTISSSLSGLVGPAASAGLSGIRYLLTDGGSGTSLGSPTPGSSGIDFYATPGGTVVPTATMSLSEYTALYERGVHNMSSKTVMLGKYDGRGPTSYIIKAGTTHAYFDMGKEFDIVKATYRLEDADMFKLFNVPFLDEGIGAGKTFHFSHDPRGDRGALGEELQYLRANGYDFDPLAMIAYPK